MPRNGSGTYSLPLPNVSGGTTIESSWSNTTLSDLATAMTNSISKNGETAWTGADDHNGNAIILDVNGDTSIAANTDDQIDFRVGGSGRASLTNASLVVAVNIRPSVTLGNDLGTSSFLFNNVWSATLNTNTIAESTAAAGVTVDGVLLKDSNATVGTLTSSGGITTNGANIMNTPGTSSTVLTINASMNSGRGLHVISANANTSSRALVLIENTNSAAVGAIPLQFTQNAPTGYMNFGGASGANTTAPVSTLTTPGSIQGFIQVLIDGTKRWIPFYGDPS